MQTVPTKRIAHHGSLSPALLAIVAALGLAPLIPVTGASASAASSKTLTATPPWVSASSTQTSSCPVALAEAQAALAAPAGPVAQTCSYMGTANVDGTARVSAHVTKGVLPEATSTGTAEVSEADFAIDPPVLTQPVSDITYTVRLHIDQASSSFTSTRRGAAAILVELPNPAPYAPTAIGVVDGSAAGSDLTFTWKEGSPGSLMGPSLERQTLIVAASAWVDGYIGNPGPCVFVQPWIGYGHCVYPGAPVTSYDRLYTGEAAAQASVRLVSLSVTYTPGPVLTGVYNLGAGIERGAVNVWWDAPESYPQPVDHYNVYYAKDFDSPLRLLTTAKQPFISDTTPFRDHSGGCWSVRYAVSGVMNGVEGPLTETDGSDYAGC